VGRGRRAAVVIGDGLDELQRRRVVVVVDRAGDGPAERYGDRCADLGAAVAAPGAGRVAGRARLVERVDDGPKHVVEAGAGRLRSEVTAVIRSSRRRRQRPVGRGRRAAVVIGDGLDELQRRRVVVVVDRAGDGPAEGEGDGWAALGAAVAAPGAGRVAGRARLVERVDDGPKHVVEAGAGRLRSEVTAVIRSSRRRRQRPVGRGRRAAVVIGDGLDELQRRRVVVVVDRAGDGPAERYGDRCADLGAAVAAPGAGRVAGRARLVERVDDGPKHVVEAGAGRLRSEVTAVIR